MTIYANVQRSISKSRYWCITLIFSWLAGLAVGSCFYKPSLFSLMRSALFQPVSIVGLFVCLFLPLLCSYFSFVTEKPVLIVIVCFFKAVAFGFSCSLISQTYGTAAWLARFLFLFSDSCFLLVLFVLWLRRFLNTGIQNMTDVYVCAVIGILIAAVDYFVISPFVVGLF